MLFGDRPQNELKKKIDSIKKSIDTLYLNILEIEEGLDIFDAISEIIKEETKKYGDYEKNLEFYIRKKDIHSVDIEGLLSQFKKAIQDLNIEDKLPKLKNSINKLYEVTKTQQEITDVKKQMKELGSTIKSNMIKFNDLKEKIIFVDNISFGKTTNSTNDSDNIDQGSKKSKLKNLSQITNENDINTNSTSDFFNDFNNRFKKKKSEKLKQSSPVISNLSQYDNINPIDQDSNNIEEGQEVKKQRYESKKTDNTNHIDLTELVD